jgi:hypothetical protein
VRNHGLAAADDQAEILGLQAAVGEILRAADQLLLQRRIDTKRYRLGAAFAPRVHDGLVVHEADLANEWWLDISLQDWLHDDGGG